MQERPSRIPCAVACELLAGGIAGPVTLVDFNERGFQILSKRRLLIGTRVELAIPGCYPVDGFVRWSIGDRAGISFKWPVRLEIIAKAVEAASTQPPQSG